MISLPYTKILMTIITFTLTLTGCGEHSVTKEIKTQSQLQERFEITAKDEIRDKETDCSYKTTDGGKTYELIGFCKK